MFLAHTQPWATQPTPGLPSLQIYGRVDRCDQCSSSSKSLVGSYGETKGSKLRENVLLAHLHSPAHVHPTPGLLLPSSPLSLSRHMAGWQMRPIVFIQPDSPSEKEMMGQTRCCSKRPKLQFVRNKVFLKHIQSKNPGLKTTSVIRIQNSSVPLSCLVMAVRCDALSEVPLLELCPSLVSPPSWVVGLIGITKQGGWSVTGF